MKTPLCCPRRSVWYCGVIALAALSAIAGEPAKQAGAPQPDPSTLPAPRRVVVPKLSATLVHDGALDEPVWTKAAVLGPFVPAGGTGQAREATTVRVWYDDRAIHLGWTCTDSDIQATFIARDSRFWEEEVVEFFVTRQDLTRYHELQWNPLGGVFDAVIRNTLDARGVSQKFDGDWGFTAPGMMSAVKVRGTVQNSTDRDVEWVVEVSIPFADLREAPPRPGEVWRANFYRFNRGLNQPVEMLSWSAPILNGFHQPSRFGFLEFGR
jgi:hypothetical protein